MLAGSVSAQIFAVSNTESEDPGRLTVSPGVGLATSFGTGAAPQTLYGILLELESVPANITVAIHSDDSGSPGSLISTLTGPVGTGQNTYRDPLNTLLAPSRTYWVLLESTSAATGLAIDKSNTVVGLPGWTIGTTVRINPGVGGGSDPKATIQFAVLITQGDAPPVPEPEEWALIAGVGLVGFGLWRRR